MQGDKALVELLQPNPLHHRNISDVQVKYAKKLSSNGWSPTQHVTKGAKVRLECRNITSGDLIYTADAVTDKQGRYSIAVDGDYEDDVCEVLLQKSPREDCSEIPTDSFTRMAAKVSLTSNNGVVDPTRYANPLGFMIRKPLPECPEVFKELGLDEQ
ncbi:hypothetical protein Droror1_Dr00004629 [Drosera rotundifolia]